MSKSKDISGVSLDFYKKARQTNKKCCSLYWIMDYRHRLIIDNLYYIKGTLFKIY